VACPTEKPAERPGHPRSLRDEPALTTDDRDDLVSRVLSTARADLAAQLSADAAPEAWLARVLELAVRCVPGAEQASICVRSDQDPPRTVRATATVAAACDRAQAELRQGPMIDVLAGADTIRVDDLAADTRWRDLRRRAAQLNVRSVLVCPLPVMRHGAGAISLYAGRPAAFTPVSESLLPVFASRASIALAQIDQVSNLHRAIDSRQQIGQAVGILMERHKLTAECAFERLVQTSQRNHVKLRDLAVHICETGQDPEDIDA
jgi:transcriptional regulator with GAF, ATPase, and Fis domain